MSKQTATLDLRKTDEFPKLGMRYFFVLLADNGQELSFSKTYSRRSTARRGGERLIAATGIKGKFSDSTEKISRYPELHR